MRISILDLETGNIKSVINILRQIFKEITLTFDVNLLKKADIIFLAGVSSFDKLVLELKKKNLFNFLREEKKIRIIGICSGMQIMFSSSEEGDQTGLGIFNDRLKKFDDKKLIVPHVGWNKLQSNDENFNEKEFYFCHSYYAPVNNDFTIAKTLYEIEFSSIVKKRNFLGIQFHPEKSNYNGKELLKKIINE